jgi:hypothetical protein
MGEAGIYALKCNANITSSAAAPGKGYMIASSSPPNILYRLYSTIWKFGPCSPSALDILIRGRGIATSEKTIEEYCIGWWGIEGCGPSNIRLQKGQNGGYVLRKSTGLCCSYINMVEKNLGDVQGRRRCGDASAESAGMAAMQLRYVRSKCFRPV